MMVNVYGRRINDARTGSGWVCEDRDAGHGGVCIRSRTVRKRDGGKTFVFCGQGGRFRVVWVGDGELSDRKGGVDGDKGGGVVVVGGGGGGRGWWRGGIWTVGSKGAAHVAECTDKSAKDGDVFCELWRLAFAELAGEVDVGEDRGGM